MLWELPHAAVDGEEMTLARPGFYRNKGQALAKARASPLYSGALSEMAQCPSSWHNRVARYGWFGTIGLARSRIHIYHPNTGRIHPNTARIQSMYRPNTPEYWANTPRIPAKYQPYTEWHNAAGWHDRWHDSRGLARSR